MKSKIVISLILATLMLTTVATPVLAGKPIRGEITDIYPSDDHPMETGKVSLQVTHDNHLKVTAVLTGGAYPKSYYVFVNVVGYGEEQLGVLWIASNGRGRFSGITSQAYTGATTARVYLRYAGDSKYNSAYLPVTFS